MKYFTLDWTITNLDYQTFLKNACSSNSAFISKIPSAMCLTTLLPNPHSKNYKIKIARVTYFSLQLLFSLSWQIKPP